MTRAKPPRAVVFDLDGTLVDSLPLVLAAITHALEPFGTRPPKDIFASLGGPPERFLAQLVADVKNVPVALARMESFHAQNAHLIRPYAGAVDMLERVRARGIHLAVWTGRDRATTLGILREHRLEGFFATVVCGDDLPTHKPNPEGLCEIGRRLAVGASDTLFVGDADVDVLGGVACGVDTLLIRHAREVAAGIAAQAWHSVLTPAEAFATVLGCLENHSPPQRLRDLDAR